METHSTSSYTRVHANANLRQASLLVMLTSHLHAAQPLLMTINYLCRYLLTPQAVYDAAVQARLPVTGTAGAAVVVESVHGRCTVAEIQESRSPVNSRTA